MVESVGARRSSQSCRLRDSLLENLRFGGLREAKVHHLVEELIDDDKVIPDGLLLELLEILGENRGEAVEEDDDLGRVGIALRKGEDWTSSRG